MKRVRRDLNRKLAAVRQYAMTHGISTDLTLRAKKCVEKESKRRAEYSSCEAEVMEFLPRTLMAELRAEAWTPVISRHGFFSMVQTDHPRCHCAICLSCLLEVPIQSRDTIF